MAGYFPLLQEEGEGLPALEHFYLYKKILELKKILNRRLSY